MKVRESVRVFVEFNELEIKNVRMEESDILKILPVASKTRDYSLPDFLDTRTKTEFNKFKIKRRADNPLHRKKAPPARVYESGYSQSQIHNSQQCKQLLPTYFANFIFQCSRLKCSLRTRRRRSMTLPRS